MLTLRQVSEVLKQLEDREEEDQSGSPSLSPTISPSNSPTLGSRDADAECEHRGSRSPRELSRSVSKEVPATEVQELRSLLATEQQHRMTMEQSLEVMNNASKQLEGEVQALQKELEVAKSELSSPVQDHCQAGSHSAGAGAYVLVPPKQQNSWLRDGVLVESPRVWQSDTCDPAVLVASCSEPPIPRLGESPRTRHNAREVVAHGFM